jgi:hypothetical protein
VQLVALEQAVQFPAATDGQVSSHPSLKASVLLPLLLKKFVSQVTAVQAVELEQAVQVPSATEGQVASPFSVII